MRYTFIAAGGGASYAAGPVKLIHLVRCFALLAATACATSAPKTPAAPAPPPRPAIAEVPLKPVDQIRSALAMRVTAASIQSIVADLDAMGRGLQLPIPLGQAAMEQLLQAPGPGMMLNRAQLDRLDPAQSMALVMLAGGTSQICGALSFKSAELARKTVEELVPADKRAGGTFAWQLTKDSWIGLSDRTLLTADSQDALASLGALAIEAQRAPRDGQAMLTLFPQNLARAQGMPLATLVELAAAGMSAKLDEAVKPAAKGGKPARGKKAAEKKDEPELTPAMNRMLVALFKAAAQPVVESEAVHLALKLGTGDGVRLRAEIVPLAGTPSAGRTKTLPYALDAKLGVGDDRTTVFAFGGAGAGMSALIGALASTGPAGKTMSQQLGIVVNELVGAGSCTMKSLAPLDNLCAFQLRPGVTPARALDGYAQAFKSSQAWNDEVMGKKKSRVTVKRSKDLVEIEVYAPSPDPRSRAMEKAMWGGDLQKHAVVARDGRLLVAQGRVPREILQRWGQPAKAGGAPIFENVAGRTRGAELLMFMDLMSVVGAVSKAAEDPSVKQVGAMLNAVPGLSELRAPMVLAMWGGKTTAFDLQFPYQTLANVAQVVRPFMGMMGGPPPSRPGR
jgi:hypothetical protein